MRAFSKRNLALFLGALCLAMIACSFQNLIISPTPTIIPALQADCKSANEPTQQDIEYSLGFTRDVFKDPEWKRSYTVGNMRTSVTWLNNKEKAVTHLEYLVWSCGYTHSDVEDYFSDKTMSNVILGGYQNIHTVSECSVSNDDLTLREFTSEYRNQPYRLLYWAKLDSPTRILTMFLAFPRDSTTMDGYAKGLFPELASCP